VTEAVSDRGLKLQTDDLDSVQAAELSQKTGPMVAVLLLKHHLPRGQSAGVLLQNSYNVTLHGQVYLWLRWLG
jgi:hypothetical protein